MDPWKNYGISIRIFFYSAVNKLMTEENIEEEIEEFVDKKIRINYVATHFMTVMDFSNLKQYSL